MRALSAAQVAQELGRSTAWLNEHWAELVKDGKLPKPLHEKGALTWNAAQLYAYLDRDLPAPIRKKASAFRAAYAAAFEAPSIDISDEIAASRERLDRIARDHAAKT